METTTTIPAGWPGPAAGMFDEPAAAGSADNGQGGTDVAQAPAWAQRQCLLDAAHSIDAARVFLGHVNLAAAVDALASAAESLMNAMQVKA